MPTYSLIYDDDMLGTAQRIEFDAPDAYAAFSIAQRQAAGRTAQLWESGRQLCTLKRVGPDGGIWEIGPVAGVTRPVAGDLPAKAGAYFDFDQA